MILLGSFVEKLDCSNISQGMIFSSYTDMCKALGVVPGRGNSLVAQKRLFNRYFTFERYNGRKCRITQVYDNPLLDDFTYNQLNCSGKGRYARYIEPMLCKLIGKQGIEPDKYYLFTKSDLFINLGFTNSYFYKRDSILRKRNDIYFKPNKNELDTASMDNSKMIIGAEETEFFEDLCNMIYDKWRSAAKAISGHGILCCETVYALLAIDNKIRVADQSELVFINQAETEVLADMELETIQQAYVNHKYKAFCKKRNVKFGEIMNIPKVSIFESIKITLNGDIQNCIDGGISLEEMQKIVNNMIVEDFYKKIDKYKREFNDGWNDKKWADQQKNVLQRKDFSEVMKKLVDLFIKI